MGDIEYKITVSGSITILVPLRQPLYDGADITDVPPAEWALACPECGTSEGLTVSGRLGEPALLTCPCGHPWTPFDGDIQAAVRLLEEVVTQSGQQNG